MKKQTQKGQCAKGETKNECAVQAGSVSVAYVFDVCQQAVSDPDSGMQV